MKGKKILNSQVFTPEEVKQGLHLDLIKHLLEMNGKSDRHYNQILVNTDGYCTMVEWVQRSYNDDNCDERFELLEYDEIPMKEVRYPDGHYDYLPREMVDQAFKEWCEEHPNYKQNQYGIWYDEEEEKALREEIENQEHQPRQLSIEDFGITIE